jgi:hypothetical protein
MPFQEYVIVKIVEAYPKISQRIRFIQAHSSWRSAPAGFSQISTGNCQTLEWNA